MSMKTSPMLNMRTLTRDDLPLLTEWRRGSLPYLRTPVELNLDHQEEFYKSVILNRASPHRYFSFTPAGPFPQTLLGVGALTYIQWENGVTEIGLITNPGKAGRGYGREMVRALLDLAFEKMRLVTVIAECYTHNPALGFWRKMTAEFGGSSVTIPRRKYWNGKLHGAELVTWTLDGWRESR